jgi:hypothetical protein
MREKGGPAGLPFLLGESGFDRGDVLEVGVLEAGWIFEAVAEEAVYGYVGGPYEGDGGGEVPVLEIADEEESEREVESVGEVVGCGAEADVGEIAEHEEVWCQEEDCEKEPAVVEVLVDEEGEEEEDGIFGAEEEGGAGQHERFIRDCGGTSILAATRLL